MRAQCSLCWHRAALSGWHKPAVQLPESAGVHASVHRGIGGTVKSFLEFFKVANCTIDPEKDMSKPMSFNSCISMGFGENWSSVLLEGMLHSFHLFSGEATEAQNG